MVRILSSGEIVADEDPRAHQVDSNIQARQTIPRRDRGFANNPPGSSQGRTTIEGDYEVTRGRGMPHNTGVFHGDTSPVSLYDAANERLRGFGIPPLTLAGITIQPVISMCAILACLILGLPGLFVVALLFAVNYATQNEAQIANWIGYGRDNSSPNQQTPGPNRPKTSGPKSNKDKIDKNAPFLGSGRKLGQN